MVPSSDFDSIVERRGSDSFKWDTILNLYGEDMIPMWVADMDFKSPESLIKALVERANHGIFGYTYRSDEYYDSIVEWYKIRYEIDIKKEWIVNGPGVVPMIAFLINLFSQPGDKIIIHPPVYPPFFRVIENNGRRIVENRLVKKGEKWTIDFENLENSIDDRTKMIIISNPHNPVGRVWTPEELEKIYEIALKKDIIVISDEIHADIVYKPNRFTSFMKIGFENVIVLNSPGKTFNIAGLTNAYGMIPDERLRVEYINYVKSLELTTGNIFSIEALKSAYKSFEWVDKLLEYLQSNRDFAYNYIKKHMSLLEPTCPEGTYLMWIDCSKTGIDNPFEFFLKNAKVYLFDGSEFGDKNCVRLNFACPRELLRKGLERMRKAYEDSIKFFAFTLPDERFKICKMIREEVFVKEQGIDSSLEMDGEDDRAIHFVLTHFSKPVAVARARDMKDYWKIERVAVPVEYRGYGYGKMIMQHIENFLRAISSKKKLALNAQSQVKDFYSKLGYKQIGDEFYEAGILHVRMEKEI
ncbi:MAG: PatB family C-S lyase [Fervidobacterium sp.]